MLETRKKVLKHLNKLEQEMHKDKIENYIWLRIFQRIPTNENS